MSQSMDISFPKNRFQSTESNDRRTAQTMRAMDAPMFASRIIKMTPGRSGSSLVISSSALVELLAAATAGVSLVESVTTGGIGSAAAGAGDAPPASSVSHEGVLGS